MIDGEGYIVTNNHIQGAEDITVIFKDDTQLKAVRWPDAAPSVASRSNRPTKPMAAVKWGDPDKSRG